jgi:hypothetical protein
MRDLSTPNFRTAAIRFLNGTSLNFNATNIHIRTRNHNEGWLAEEVDVVDFVDSVTDSHLYNDLHVSTYASIWAVCRPTDWFISNLVTVNFTHPNGSLVAFDEITDEISISIPVFYDALQSRLQSLEMETQLLETDICPPVVRPNFSNTCGWWDTEAEVFRTDGCMGTLTLNESAEEAWVMCTCTHLTEFVLLGFNIRQSSPCESSWKPRFTVQLLFVAFMYACFACYAVLALVAARQLLKDGIGLIQATGADEGTETHPTPCDPDKPMMHGGCGVSANLYVRCDTACCVYGRVDVVSKFNLILCQTQTSFSPHQALTGRSAIHACSHSCVLLHNQDVGYAKPSAEKKASGEWSCQIRAADGVSRLAISAMHASDQGPRLDES